MTIDSVNSGRNRNYVSQIQPQQQSHAERVTERENDGDRDDGSNAAMMNAPSASATINTSGQVIGSIIHVKA